MAECKRSDIDGFPVIRGVFAIGWKSEMSVKADEDHVYIPFVYESEHGTVAYYLEADKRLLQTGEVQK